MRVCFSLWDCWKDKTLQQDCQDLHIDLMTLQWLFKMKLMQKILSDQSTAKYSMLEKTNRAAWVKVDNLEGLGKYRTRTGKTREKIVVSFLPQGALNQYVHLQQRERLILSIIIWIQDPGKRKLCKDGGLSSNRAQGLEQLKMESVLRAPDRTSSGTHLLW